MIASKRVALFGCKSTTLYLYRQLKRDGIKVDHLITIDPITGEKNDVADYLDLQKSLSNNDTKIYIAKQYSLNDTIDLEIIRNFEIDIAFVIGWQRLIPAEILRSMSVGAFGMHGSSMNLPLGRGRSPMNWSIIEGRKYFYTNLFRYAPGIDDGDVVDTYKFQIGERDTAETMHYKNMMSMNWLICKNIERIANGTAEYQPQRKDILPTYYPKRKPEDSIINWKQDICLIERHIRAVTKPFNGAFSFIGTQKIIIWDAQIFDVSEFGFERSTEGTIVLIYPTEKLLIKCFGGLLLVNNYESSTKIAEGSILGNNGFAIPIFDRNEFGNFDLP